MQSCSPFRIALLKTEETDADKQWLMHIIFTTTKSLLLLYSAVYSFTQILIPILCAEVIFPI